jgi:tetratricopeptide (TPR) repeat protein
MICVGGMVGLSSRTHLELRDAARIWNDLSWKFLEHKRPQEAKTSIEDAIFFLEYTLERCAGTEHRRDVLEMCSTAYHYQGLVFYGLGDLDQAIKNLRSSELHPRNNTSALRLAANLSCLAKKCEEATRACMELLKIDEGDNSDALYALCIYFSKTQDNKHYCTDTSLKVLRNAETRAQ